MWTKRITTALVALTMAGVLGACSGGGGGNGSGDGDDGVASLSDDSTSEQAQADDQADDEAELLDWVECMRGEGIDLPDPTRDADGNLVINGPGINIGGGGSGGTVQNQDAPESDEQTIDPEDMDAASEVCGAPPAVGGAELSDEDQQAQQDAALEFAQCMRDEGIDDFPDPDFSDSGPGGAPQTNSSSGGDGGGPVVGGPFGQIDLDDPEVAAAFEACQDLIGPPAGEDGSTGEAPEPTAADEGAA
jgi:hypothetical protein